MTSNNDGLEEFERELGVALRRVDAPAGLVGSVMRKAEARRSKVGLGRVLNFPRRQAWIGSVAASLLVVGLMVGGVEHRRAVERTRADRDFARSLEITDRAMEQTREHLQRAGVVVD